MLVAEPIPFLCFARSSHSMLDVLLESLALNEMEADMYSA